MKDNAILVDARRLHYLRFFNACEINMEIIT